MVTWHVLRWTWAAVVIGYCVLHIFAAKRLRDQAGRNSRNIFIAMVVLVAIRILIQRVFGVGLAYRLAVVFVGVAAGIAALVEARMLLAQKAGDDALDAHGAEERIQSLRLN